MDNREHQKELFGEYEDERPHFRAAHGLLARRPSISVPLERIIFTGIGVLMALVIVYALGVERGKALSKREARLGSVRKAQAPAEAAGSRPYTVFLTVFRERRSADAEAEKLKREGYAPFLTTQGEYLRLYAGRFASLEDALKAHNALKAKYADCSIKKFQ